MQTRLHSSFYPFFIQAKGKAAASDGATAEATRWLEEMQGLRAEMEQLRRCVCAWRVGGFTVCGKLECAMCVVQLMPVGVLRSLYLSDRGHAVRSVLNDYDCASSYNCVSCK